MRDEGSKENLILDARSLQLDAVGYWIPDKLKGVGIGIGIVWVRVQVSLSVQDENDTDNAD